MFILLCLQIVRRNSYSNDTFFTEQNNPPKWYIFFKQIKYNFCVTQKWGSWDESNGRSILNDAKSHVLLIIIIIFYVAINPVFWVIHSPLIINIWGWHLRYILKSSPLLHNTNNKDLTTNKQSATQEHCVFMISLRFIRSTVCWSFVYLLSLIHWLSILTWNNNPHLCRGRLICYCDGFGIWLSLNVLNKNILNIGWLTLTR